MRHLRTVSEGLLLLGGSSRPTQLRAALALELRKDRARRSYGSSRSPLDDLRSAPTSSVAGAIRLRTAREEPALTS
jgi:hypothetical protein